MTGKIANFKAIVWDYKVSESDFKDILDEKKTIGSFDQSWAVKRVLENTNYYEAMSLVSKDTLVKYWNSIKPKLFNKSIIKGYDFLLHRYTLSDSVTNS